MSSNIQYIRDGRAPIPEKESTSRVMSSNKNRDTKPELTLRRALWQNGIKGYRLHWGKIPGRPDIAFPGKRFALFVNGCFWHRCPFCKPTVPKSHSAFWLNKFEQNVKRDKITIIQLKKIGWKTLTIWECQIKNNPNKFVNKIKTVLNYV